MNARTQAVARMDDEIATSQQRAIAAAVERGRPKNALEAMAMRLQVSPAGLKETLLNTVFKGCRNDAEFIALTIVSNEYGLNPLTKEIYAFPAKGGGIVPMVSVDGWIRIMNDHPQFDGIEFENIVDQKGDVEAIEAVVYRKDRTRPVRVIEYLDECKRNTDPWNMMPKRMLRNKALIQGARIAFGFSGIYSEEDPEAEYRNVTPQRMPSAEELNQQQVINHDPDTGEVSNEPARDGQTGMTEVDEETARALDAEQTYQDLDGEQDEGEGEPEPEQEDPKKVKLREIEQMAANATNLKEARKADSEWWNHRVVFDEATQKTMDAVMGRLLQKFTAAE
jgi:phage recombination protein Bet